MMRVARDLGYTLTELGQRMTVEEMQLWSALYQVEAQEEEEALKKARR